MKKISFLPSAILVLTIMGLSSCAQKYGCYYSQSPELKVHSHVEASKLTSISHTAMIEATVDSQNCNDPVSTIRN